METIPGRPSTPVTRKAELRLELAVEECTQNILE